MKEHKTFEEVKENFTKYLKKQKHRQTPERYSILENIYKYEGHFGAEKLHEEMQKSYPVSLATIYNTIKLLLDCGLIVKHQFDLPNAQFEKTFVETVHHHLICTECGRIKEFSDKNIRTSIQKKVFAKFEPSHYTLYIYGKCEKCKRKNKR
jgi:Fur family ferric uptake transcriptional regulator